MERVRACLAGLLGMGALLAVAAAPPARAVELAPGDAIVVESGYVWNGVPCPAAIWKVDPLLLGQELIATGGLLGGPSHVALEPSGTLLVSDGQFLFALFARLPQPSHRLIRVDPATGAQTLLTSFPANTFPAGVAVEPDGGILVLATTLGNPVAFSARLVRIDPVTGAQTPLTAPFAGVMGLGLVLEASGQAVAAFASYMAGQPTGLYRIDPATGSSQLLSAGPPVADPFYLERAPGGELYATSFSSWSGIADPNVVEVHPGSGAQTLLFPDWSGYWWVGLAAEGGGGLLLTDGTWIYRGDPPAGELTPFAGPFSCYAFGITRVRPACGDGLDNDADGRTDYRSDGSGDLGCASLSGVRENPQCQDGVNNDGQLGTDFDGGASVPGAGVDPNGRDPQCVGQPTKNRERGGCGLGFEVAPALALLALRRRRALASG